MIKEDIKLMNNPCHIKHETDKSRIVIGDSYNYGLSHLNITHNYNNGDKSCPHFTIMKDGSIYRHFNLKYYSNYLNLDSRENISICLENLSVLNKINNQYFDIYNNEYKGEIHKRKWKGQEFWIPYTGEQFDSLAYLLVELYNKFKFSVEDVKESNVFDKEYKKIKGVSYRSNFNKNFLDPNPSLDFKKIKKIVLSEIK